MRTIAVTNQKGGVGKTTTVANLGAALAARGVNVCLIDLDPQSHLTMHFGIDPSGLSASVYDVLTAEATLGSAAVLVETNLTVIPSIIDLAAAEVELASAVGREQILRDRMLAEKLPYEMILVDCAPSLGLLTLNALAAVDEVVIPLQPHFLALQGFGKLLETVSLVQRRINPRLKVTGVVLCMYESATRLAGEVTADVEQFIESSRGKDLPWSTARIFRTRIRRNIKLAECPGYGTTIIHYDPSSHGAADYAALAEEFCPATPPARAAPEEEAKRHFITENTENTENADNGEVAKQQQQQEEQQQEEQRQEKQQPLTAEGVENAENGRAEQRQKKQQPLTAEGAEDAENGGVEQ